MKKLLSSTLGVVLLLAHPASAQKFVPIQVKPLTPQQIAKQLDLSCPLKIGTIERKKTMGGALVDKDNTYFKDEARYCKTLEDWNFCQANNVTPSAPCKLIDPLIPEGIVRASLCPLTRSGLSLSEKDLQTLGGHLGLDVSTSIQVNIYTCQHGNALDSCRYYYQQSVTTRVTNAGLFAVDKITTGTISGCKVDEASEAAFQAEVNKNRPTLTGLLDVKKKYWLGKCPANSEPCKKQVESIWTKAAMEAHGRLAQWPAEGSPFEMMKAITKLYDPQVDAEVAKHPKSSNFPG